MSEPDAGSDLAGLRTRAVLDGDRFVVNGQKVWTSGAHDADVILAFVRTDPDAPKHKGISVLLVPTDSPGLTRRPFGSIVGPDDLDFNEVFFDDVEVPAENLIGPLHEGWRVATGSLGHERAMLWLGFAERLEDLTRYGARRRSTGSVPSTTPPPSTGSATCWSTPRPCACSATARWPRPGAGIEAAEQSILKLFGSEAVQRGTLRVLEALGPDGLDHTVPSGPQPPPRHRRAHRRLVRALPAELRRHHRRRDLPDPAQHRRRAGPRPAALIARGLPPPSGSVTPRPRERG